ncbi:MAG: hypothetical protein GWN29_13075 [Gammaproteobacteria bacterium]|nr:hypothetical protein [Gammaproteobacteria bacterium]
MTLRKLVLTSVTAAAVAIPMLATADSDQQVGAPGATQAQANLDFRISIPTFIYFQIGSAGATIDTVDFDLAAGPTTPGSGPLNATSGTVNVVLRTNATNLNLTANSGGVVNLQNAAGDTIPLTDITGAATGTEIPHPAAFGGTAAVTPTNTDITDNTETWTFTFANGTVYPAGVYGDGAGNGRTVAYTIADF